LFSPFRPVLPGFFTALPRFSRSEVDAITSREPIQGALQGSLLCSISPTSLSSRHISGHPTLRALARAGKFRLLVDFQVEWHEKSSVIKANVVLVTAGGLLSRSNESRKASSMAMIQGQFSCTLVPFAIKSEK
jgi:hypothetical protein